MAASYVVSRTVSPVCCALLLRPPRQRERFPRWLLLPALAVGVAGLALWLAGRLLPLLPDRLSPAGLRAVLWLARAGAVAAAAGSGVAVLALLFWTATAFERLFEHVTAAYEWLLRRGLRRRLAVLALLAAAAVPAGLDFRRTGQELFPEVDSGEFTVHVRLTGGPRVEETERQVAEVEELVREVVPPEDRHLILSNVGISSRWSAIYTPNNGPHAAFVRVQLRSGFAGRHTPTLAYVGRLEQRLRERFPGDDVFFETGGMIRRILNAGAGAPVEVRVHARDPEERRRLVRRLDGLIGRLPGVRDTFMPQEMQLPQLRIEVDRTKAALLGYTENDVVRNVIAALMSSAQIAPNFWIDPESGNPYFIGVQFPEHAVEDLATLENIPITGDRGRAAGAAPRLLKEVARIERAQAPVEVYHQSADACSQILVSVADNDLAGVGDAVERIVAAESLPRGTRVTVHGEISSMRESFREMAFSLALAVLLVYLVMAAQFQSWLDPLVMIVAAPLGLVGVAGALWLTGTSLNVQSCMGVLMMVGISVSNSVLLVEFANRQLAGGLAPLEAAVAAARVRLRPILMTTLATVAGLLPMAVHLRPGDEMNLPLARAVIGGLVASTLLTLFVVPVLYTLVKQRGAAAPAEPAAV
jgi:multidrug efflux pump subunit AcrB